MPAQLVAQEPAAQFPASPSYWATTSFFCFSGLSAATEVVMFTNRSNYQPVHRQRQRLIEGHQKKPSLDLTTGT
ncbi:hypothetical protein [Ensifer sp. SL37]|jgi:hypothetical protein|uniref:hypothetical protein n=1 Tax=Ensifer sp. SL37 TaxID=2995137 RepID=UPI00227446B4|nr:hypothetical protein [Ensifer sp. SL37]MCY1743334.1 hypothetical protein [Ensifer sp. SL37]